VPEKYPQSLDLELLSSKALEQVSASLLSAAMMTLTEKTVDHLKAGLEIEEISFPSLVLDRKVYTDYLDAFRLELVMAGLWDLHNGLRGSTDPFRICRAASEAEERLALLRHRLLVPGTDNQ